MLQGSTQFLLLITAVRHVTPAPPLPRPGSLRKPPTPPVNSVEVCPLSANIYISFKVVIFCFCYLSSVVFLIVTQLLWGLHKQLTKTTAHEAAVSLSGLVVLGTGSVL